MRRSLAISLAVILLAAVFAGVLSAMAPPTTDRLTAEPADEPRIFRFREHESGFHPYLNSHPSFAELSPVNVVVRGNLSEVLSTLTERGGITWNETEPAAHDVGPEDYAAGELNLSAAEIAWGRAEGAHRYAYVHDGEEGRWVEESDQLHDGDYFGHRFHVRLYASPDPGEDWVALQAHAEHFDWFTLRHAVDGAEAGQRHLEVDLMTSPSTDRVVRTFLGNDGASDSDGWATVVELAAVLPLTLLGAVSLPRVVQRHLAPEDRHRLEAALDRLSLRHAVLGATILAIVLGVRVLGLVFEHQAPSLDPFTIAGILYPVLAIGLPVATYLAAHGLERRMEAGVIAAGAMALALLIDYSAIGVDVLPLDIVVHRVAVIVALGMIAAGAARRAHRQRHLNGLLASGLVVWAGLLAATGLGWI